MLRLFMISVLLAVSAPAQADWQNTKWGMSEAELSATMKGAVSASPKERKDGALERYGQPAISAPYSASGMDFRAYFYFDRDRLVGVSLDLNDASGQAGRLIGLLDGQYRMPRESRDRPSSGCRSIYRVWDDAEANNEVVLSAFLCPSGGPAIAGVKYFEPIAKSRSGL